MIYTHYVIELDLKKRLIKIIYFIQNADENDISSLAQIEAECIANPWSENSFREEMANENSIIIKAVNENGAICGFVSAVTMLDEVSIYNVAVKTSYRRNGIAKNLLLHLEDITKTSANFYMLEVRESNLPAIKLYHSLGYQNVGLRKNYYQSPCENAILMTKSLERTINNEDTCN